MQILSLELENIKSYERAVVQFTPGVNAIVGHNGAGKSTILEAIGYVLFDSLQYKAGDFIREGARTGSVAVSFLSTYDQRAYRVERRFGGSHAYFVFDIELQQKLCEGRVDVLAFVRRHTGVDPATDLGRIFDDAIGVPQGSLTAEFLLTPAQRKPTFDRLLQVEEYKEAFDKLLESRNSLKERRSELTQETAVLESRLERLPVLDQVVAERAGAIVEAQTQLRQLQAELAEIEKGYQEQESLRNEVEQHRATQAQLNERQLALATQQATTQRSLAEAEEARQRIIQSEAGYRRYLAAQDRKLQLDAQQKQRQLLLAEHAAADRQLAVIAAESKASEDALTAALKAEQMVQELADEVAKQANLEQELDRVRLSAARLVQIEQQLAAQQKQLLRYIQRWQQLEDQFGRVAGVQGRLQAIDGQVNALRAGDDDRKAELATLQFEAERIKQQNALLGEATLAQCPVCAQPLSSEHRAAVLQGNEDRIVELRSRYASLKAIQKQSDAETQALLLEQKQLLLQLQELPRAVDVEDAHQLVQQAEAAVGVLETECATLRQAPDAVSAVTATLQALDNPRQRSALAAQQAARRPLLAQEVANLTERHKNLEVKLTVLDVDLGKYIGLDADLQVTAGELEATLSEYQAVLANQRLASRCDDLAFELQRLTSAHLEVETEVAALEIKLKSAQMKFDPVKYARLLSEGQSIRSQQASITARLSMLDVEQDRDLTELTILRGQQQERARLQLALQALREQEDLLDAVRNALKQSGPYITQALIRQISADSTRIFGELMQDFSRELRWNDDYGITLELEGVTRQFAQLSGGEQMSAALAVRLALVRAMSNIDIAFFDEPTAHLDDVRREALAQQILNVRGFCQLFVISHDDTFEQATQNLVRVSRHGSYSIVSTSNTE